jgi:hypothetical protein
VAQRLSNRVPMSVIRLKGKGSEVMKVKFKKSNESYHETKNIKLSML